MEMDLRRSNNNPFDRYHQSMNEDLLQIRPIDRIRNHANISTCCLLDRQPTASDTVLRILAKHASCQQVLVDVPLSAIVGLMRSDFWCEGQSWREILAGDERNSLRLTGEGWEDFERIVSHIEGSIERFNFPAVNGFQFPFKSGVDSLSSKFTG